MLKIKIPLERTSTGTITKDSVLAYEIKTQPFKEELIILFWVYNSLEDLIAGKTAVNDLEVFLRDGKVLKGVKYTPDKSLLNGLNITDFIQLTDELVKVCVEENFLGGETCECIGTGM
tara:strand:+ start:344 stop:697 length:354 start_codon:yes stop_codon:yes gene_type:complete